jgi:hypothetical protein
MTSKVVSGDMAKAIPSASRLGQEMFTSIAATEGSAISATALANDSEVSAEIDTISGVEKAE